MDLSCAAFSDAGQFIAAAYHNCPSILEGCVRHCGDNPTGATAAQQDSEVVHIYPALVPAECCLLMFTVTGQLPDCEALGVTCYAKERKKQKVLGNFLFCKFVSRSLLLPTVLVMPECTSQIPEHCTVHHHMYLLIARCELAVLASQLTKQQMCLPS